MAEEYNIEDIKLQIAQLQAEKAKSTASLQAKREEVEQAEKAYLRARNEREQLRKQAEETSALLRDAERELASKLRLKSVEEEQERLRQEFLDKSKELDELTAQAQWREFAFDHQIFGGKKLALSSGGILADKRGLGKTLTSLVWLDMLQSKKIIVIAPNDVVSEFQKEILHWTKRTIMPFSGMPKDQRDVVYPYLKMLDEFIVTLNYEAWRRDKTIIDDLVAVGVDTIVIDEAHRAKSWNKVTARGIFQLRYRPNYCPTCKNVDNFMGPWFTAGAGLVDYFVGEVAWNAPRCTECDTVLESTVKHCLSMTGTPFLNKPQELFSLLFLHDRHMFPDEKSFLRDYCYSYAPNRWKFKTGGLERLTNQMSEFFLQRNREDAGITIPPPAVTIHEIEKDFVKYRKQYKAEADITAFGAMYYNQEKERKDIFFLLELLLRERQCMTWPAGIRITDPDTKELICNFDVEESQKLDEATAFMKELLDEDERVVVFSQFVPPMIEMHRRLAKDHPVTLATGQQSKFHRDMVKEDFDLKTAPKEPRWNGVFSTYKALGTGVNLNAARHMILLDDEWNPGGEDQAIGRIDRLNSTDQANVHIFRVKDSIDDFMAALLAEKKQLTEDFETAPAFELLSKFFRDRGLGNA
jgi:SNF2 family DNA or RNA helicase